MRKSSWIADVVYDRVHDRLRIVTRTGREYTYTNARSAVLELVLLQMSGIDDDSISVGAWYNAHVKYKCTRVEFD